MARELLQKFGKGAILQELVEMAQEGKHLTWEEAQAIAGHVGTSPEEVVSVASFYHLIPKEPRGKYHFLVCTNVSCMLNGAYDVLGWLRELLGVEPGQVTGDGLFSYEETECIGACDIAPAALLNGERVGPLSRESLAQLIEKLRKEAGDAS